MLLPCILPTATSLSFLMVAMTVVASSCDDVPIAISQPDYSL